MTRTREAKPNIGLCKKKIAHFTSACFNANNIITRNMRKFSSDQSMPKVTVVIKRAHDLLLDYIKEATQGSSKMNINRICRASLEKDEWMALKAFKDIASEQQKMYAKTVCKPAIKRGEIITSTQVISNVDVDDEEPVYDDDEVLTQKNIVTKKRKHASC
ncbi:unnamed protein product [Rotaria magnacalcarata]|uniref:Uncharacterized protein n=1 Tax=Rotaria magnacalcarata TaxID=392030 RepID=A0A816WWT3_9BILA|nr:unnamed protein product [Rotaria magnacalcarata]